MNADDTDKKGLPRMNADGRGFEPVEWKPSPDMYRMDTPEGREAYEASFRMKIEPRLGDERKPLRSGIAPDDRAETYAKLHPSSRKSGAIRGPRLG
jgi:hypothetical protein